ncbi:MAG: FIST N-terminal domain-containing protein [Cyanobacteriota bacterium]|nr:FIST N-terminal domain-containing protein [Cyanobacteriota bacterium]
MAGLSLTSFWPRRQGGAWCRTALASTPSLEAAVEGITTQLRGCETADLALVFCSASYASDLPRLLPLLRKGLRAQHWLGCLGGGVIGAGADGTPHELEKGPGLSVTLLRLPGARLQPFSIDPTELPDLDGPSEPWRQLVAGRSPAGQPEEFNGSCSMLLLLDPACPGINDLINGLDYAFPTATKLGGIACQHSSPHGSLLYDEEVRGGAVGCLIDGAWSLEAVVAQGCRPIGPVLEVEQAQRNVVLQVSAPGHRPNSPVAALQSILTQLSPQERDLVKHSLFLGVAREDFSLAGHPDGAPATFLVRNLIGVDPRNGAVAVAERMRVGQQVQFHLRDGSTSRQELQSVLEALARRHPAPLGGFLFTCLGRGQGLYGEADGDAGPCHAIFPDLPLSGAFCNGEIGPIGTTTHLHGYAASFGFLVPNPT